MPRPKATERSSQSLFLSFPVMGAMGIVVMRGIDGLGGDSLVGKVIRGNDPKWVAPARGTNDITQEQVPAFCPAGSRIALILHIPANALPPCSLLYGYHRPSHLTVRPPRSVGHKRPSKSITPLPEKRILDY